MLHKVFLGVPNEQERLEILKCLTQSIPLKTDVDLSKVAEATPGFVGADLAGLCQQACLYMYRNGQVC